MLTPTFVIPHALHLLDYEEKALQCDYMADLHREAQLDGRMGNGSRGICTPQCLTVLAITRHAVQRNALHMHTPVRADGVKQ